MSKWAINRALDNAGWPTTSTHTVPILGGRKRQHHDRLHLGIVIGALVVLAAWGVSELLR